MAKQSQRTAGKATARANGGKVAKRGLSKADLANQQVAELPDREAMSLANINLAAPINLAAALNVLSDGSIAAAGAQQTGPIDQST
jgi:hypothetical protein